MADHTAPALFRAPPYFVASSVRARLTCACFKFFAMLSALAGDVESRRRRRRRAWLCSRFVGSIIRQDFMRLPVNCGVVDAASMRFLRCP